MNSLLRNSLKQKIASWNEMKKAFSKIANEKNNFSISLYGLHGVLYSLFIDFFSDEIKNFSIDEKKIATKTNDIFIVTATEDEARSLENDLQSVSENYEIFFLPNWSNLPYRANGKGSSIFGKRARVLSEIIRERKNFLQKKSRFFLMSEKTFLSPFSNPNELQKNSFSLSLKQKIDTIELAKKLSNNFYTRVPRVYLPGEFSLRGEVLDVFVPDDENPKRIVFDFDEISAIKSFDAETQKTLFSFDEIFISPKKEIIWNDEKIAALKNFFSDWEKSAIDVNEKKIEKNESFSNEIKKQNCASDGVHLPFSENAKFAIEKIFDELKNFGESEGEEFFYSFIEKKYSIRDFISENSFVFFLDFDRIENAEEIIFREYEGMYRKEKDAFPIFPPSECLFSLSEMLEKFSKCIFFRTIVNESEQVKSNSFVFHSLPAKNFFGNVIFLKEEFSRLLENDWKIFIFAEGENQASRIKQLLIDFSENKNCFIFSEAISEGFSIPDEKILVVSENEIFGRKKKVSSLKNVKSQKIIDTFVELNPGDYIVHVQYGIGIFKSIERIKTLTGERDYIKLLYADDDIVFVPIEQVNLVQRYIGNENREVHLDKIGSASWENRKRKAREDVEELAKKLLDLYSKRASLRGFPFPKDDEWQKAFEASFPYEDTKDQASATEEIKADMEKAIPMDRLLCGDVGYGKTELAFRASFKAVMAGKQVAFLAPTTILAEQHYESALSRFEHFPVKLGLLSRFVNLKEQKIILEKVQTGEIDILIGTHRIIQKDVVFKNLGLLVIDEEQRFGVRDKEKLKTVKTNIDCLSLSATPIPRTLHMSLLKIRDMSLLTTPPQNRQAIKTFVEPYKDERIAKAIRDEVARSGQVFFLHNRVESLAETKFALEKIVPEMSIETAHGKMSANELEEIFRRFKLGGFHVLVSTTIIENGIDIPNVNTIIIDRADMYGVSQLYQLRGRVGRSDRLAYAYLCYPENASLSELAMKRLETVSDFTELGSGFKIAMKDMELRGAGNLLGKDQSGDVYSVGFDLYMKLLQEAVERLQAKDENFSNDEVILELEYSAFIPTTYIESAETKMEVYKKIARVETDDELVSLQNEIEDRFGPIPDEAESLFSLAEIRILCNKLHIVSLKEKNGNVAIEFSRVKDISIDKLLAMIKDSEGSVRLDQSKANMIFLKVGNISLKEKSLYIYDRLKMLL